MNKEILGIGTIVANQIISDLSELLKDIESGMFNQNLEGLKKEWNRIYQKGVAHIKLVKKEIQQTEDKLVQIVKLMEKIEQTCRLKELLKCNVKIGEPKND